MQATTRITTAITTRRMTTRATATPTRAMATPVRTTATTPGLISARPGRTTAAGGAAIAGTTAPGTPTITVVGMATITTGKARRAAGIAGGPFCFCRGRAR